MERQQFEAHPQSVASALFVREDRGEILLVEGKSGKLYLPGGKLEPDENFETALIRELTEELGLKFKSEHFEFFDEGRYETPSGSISRIKTFKYLGILEQNSFNIVEGDSVKNVSWRKIGDILKNSVTKNVWAIVLKLKNK